MGISDWFRKGERAPGRWRFHDDRGRMFDLERTRQLAALFGLPAGERDARWTEAFFDAAWCASVALAEPQVFTGPDGFPYLRLDVPGEGAFDSQCLANLAGSCLDHGVGAAFFASPGAPPEAAQFVLSLGLIDSLVRYDSPAGDPVDAAEAALPPEAGVFTPEPRGGGDAMRVEKTHEVLVGTPSADYLPPHLARSLHGHLTGGWGMTDPTVQLVADLSMRPHRSLVIGRKRSEFPADAPVDEMVQALIWHLDPGRMLMLMPEDWSQAQMTPLRNLFESR